MFVAVRLDALQVLPFTTMCLKSILAGQLGRFASSLWARTSAFQNR
jgi:hypothetical protein